MVDNPLPMVSIFINRLLFRQFPPSGELGTEEWGNGGFSAMMPNSHASLNRDAAVMGGQKYTLTGWIISMANPGRYR
ncbi:hypothetical protein ANRL3_01183 [Anaerolineae bacterium]|nr:hypothetical protein ANRL3_01183 [Anaerolineae bacterium]